MAYPFLKKLKLRKGKLWHKDYRFVADGAPWSMVWHKVKPYSELGLRLIHDGSLLKPPERLSKEVKRRLKDFSYLRPFLYCTSHANAKVPSAIYPHGLKPGKATIT
ncbi:hypothetical protein KEJ19_00870 [Candidatus Bathyarchaeota archaeon]|nr:hypothetical protein [Candidatus Bathyarchaeota archaeon]